MRQRSTILKLSGILLAILMTVSSGCKHLSYDRSNQPISFMGLDNTALGEAELRIQGEDLLVTNLGKTGRDGVRVNFKRGPSGVAGWGLTQDDAFDSQQLPVGAYEEIKEFGFIDGKETHLGGTRTENLGEDVRFSWDYSALGEFHVSLRFFLDDELVGEIGNYEENALYFRSAITCIDYEHVGGQSDSTSGSDTTGTSTWAYVVATGSASDTTSTPSDSTSTGGNVLAHADRVAITFTHMTSGVDIGDFTAIEVLTSQIPSLLITEERAIQRRAEEHAELVR